MEVADLISGVVSVPGSGAVGRAPFNHRRARYKHSRTKV